jgi:hypothetical protein
LSGLRALCVDTDALVNLLALDAFDFALDGLGISRADCFRLRAAKHQISKAAWIGTQWPFFDRDKACSIVEDLRLLPKIPSADLLEALNINGIDEGEALFLATLSENPEYMLMSGDRRMLEALHGASDIRLVRVREAIRGRVILFPQVVAALVRKLSLRVVETRIRTGLCRHHTLRILFGSMRPTDPEHFREAYEAEMRTCVAICGEDWLYPFGGSLPPSRSSLPGDGSPLLGR